jgi:hypothetical protein
MANSADAKRIDEANRIIERIGLENSKEIRPKKKNHMNCVFCQFQLLEKIKRNRPPNPSYVFDEVSVLL